MTDLCFWLLSVSGLMSRVNSIIADSAPSSRVSNTSAVFFNKSAICPGVESLLTQNNTNTTSLEVHIPNCKDNLPEFTWHQGVVYGGCGDSGTFCKMMVVVPQTTQIRARVRRLAYWCNCNKWKAEIYSPQIKTKYSENLDIGILFICNEHSLDELLFGSKANRMLILSYNNPLIRIWFETFQHHSIVVTYVATYSGFVLVPRIKHEVSNRREVKVPSSHSIMVSLQQTPIFIDNSCRLQLVYRERNTAAHHDVCIRRNSFLLSKLLPTSCITFVSKSGTVKETKIYFSSLSENNQPTVLLSGQFNCSVTHYSQFQDHLHCNLKPECEDGRDETEHCPFSGPGCHGLVATRDKCFQLMEFDTEVPMATADFRCGSLGGRIASVKTRQEQNDFIQLFKDYGEFYVDFGLFTGWHNLPFHYSQFRHWSDGTLTYDIIHLIFKTPYKPSRRVKRVVLLSTEVMVWMEVKEARTELILCEIKLQSQTLTKVSLPFFNNASGHRVMTVTRQLLLVCPRGHVTQSCLICGSNCQCRTRKADYVHYCPFFVVSIEENATWVPQSKDTLYQNVLFRCDDGVSTVHYTLVCDFRQDCPHSSDESFCDHPSCYGFLCSNGQCVLHGQRCNEFSDCLDDSDEVGCPTHDVYQPLVREYQDRQQFVMSLDGTGYFTQVITTTEQPCPETEHRMNTEHSCPAGHYRCTSVSLHCLPIYTRCNQHPDCTYAEDEQDCDRFTCPGYYQCRASTVCVHGDQLCDGWGQCPQRDDELMCDRTCPEGCLCQGHAVLCRVPFTADTFSQFRYVDVQGSGMTLADWSEHPYIIRLTLSLCQLSNLSSTKLSNLQFMDLADNYLRTIDISVFQQLQNLRILNLANNPLCYITSVSLKYIYFELQHMDISRTYFQILNNRLSLYLPNLTYLNMSSSGIQTIMFRGFKVTPKLTELDIRHNLVNMFPLDLLSTLNHLKKIFASNYRLCCENLLSKQSIKIQCQSPQPMISSCHNLLPSTLYAIFFWIILTFSVLGNLVNIMNPFAGHNTVRTSFNILSVNVQLAHICMGIHAGIILFAHYQLFYGNYIHLDKTWTTSVTCKMAGFLSLLSSEVSVLIFVLATLDHIAVLCFPAGSWRFDKPSTVTECSVTWFVGALLALVPYLPGLSHWGTDGQSGLCRLALFNNSDQEFRWFTATGALNVTLTALTVAGLVVVHTRIPKHLTVVMDPSKRPVYSSAQLLVRLVATEAACWCWLGVSWVMAWLGVAVAGRMREVLVLLLLPISAAVCPLVHMWTTVSMERRQAQDRRLLDRLKARLAGAKTQHQEILRNT